ncbi:LOW QUALITY PROTEIN: arginyl-tRNA--protein transferase 1-like [Haliotis rubra]|uniref:LOW QUALITY PROTEIN: arginyl-tRNA--protein transferase 1-like n=1 Tax=Haliotis rubra TaxID=36100 RepID=UPI001EE5D705|nr:LOW QUALITY PROTEIN: arginyl-tRNA--protein transferase 1-like [Haliotis rubra]
MASTRSIVEYLGDHERYRCGYCGSSDTNYSHGMWAHSMTVQDYEDLINRGWRRSGKYCYKPTMKVTCCPHYTIKQDAPNFKITKSHKKVIKRVNKFLIYGIKKSDESDKVDDESEPSDTHVGENLERLENILPSDLKLKADGVKLKTDLKGSVQRSVQREMSLIKVHHPPWPAQANKLSKEKAMDTEVKQPHQPQPGSGADPSRPPSRKAKDIRRERKLQKLSDKGVDAEAAAAAVQSKKLQRMDSEMKMLEDYLNEPEQAPSVAHKLQIRLVRSSPKSEEFVSSFKAAHTVYSNYQMTIHKDPPGKPNQKQYTRFLVDSPLQTRLVLVNPHSNDYRTSFTESHQVFKKYQMSVHKEGESDCSKQNFTEFLANSPLEPMSRDGGPTQGYGSFHQHYILDGKIIAVGVIDILPHCISSVYLYYDPEYSFLSLGTYSALREIAFVRELQQRTPELRFYYMGFYIHSCPKMRYKGQYFPSYLACPEAYTWVPIDKCRPKLDASHYARLEEDGVEDDNGNIDLDRVLVLYDSEAMPYEVYSFLKPNDEAEVKEYAMLAGKTCAERMLLFRK